MDRTGENPFKLANSVRERAKAVFRFVCFWALFVAVIYAIGLVLGDALEKVTTFEGHVLEAQAILAAGTLIATFIMAKATGQKFGIYGYYGRNGLWNLLIGIICGIALLAALLLAMNILGCFSFGTITASGSALLYSGLLYAALFLAVGFSEESLFRGYALIELSRAISFWPAAILLALAFGAPHWIKGGGENFIGALQACLFGIAFAYSFRQTGSLWLAIGVHSGWDYAESFIFGVPDSGVLFAGRALNPATHGPDWLTGGSVGPEGSVLAIFPLAAIVYIATFIGSRQHSFQPQA